MFTFDSFINNKRLSFYSPKMDLVFRMYAFVTKHDLTIKRFCGKVHWLRNQCKIILKVE